MEGYYNAQRGYKTLQSFMLINAAVKSGETILILTMHRKKEYFANGLMHYYPGLKYKCRKVKAGYLFKPSSSSTTPTPAHPNSQP
jgi:hypothetical protein